MKVELQCGDIVTIPEGCKATIKDGSVVFEKEFKDGDILHSIHDSLMLIYKGCSSSECFNSHFNTLHNHNFGWNIHLFRHATEEEKQLLFNKMKEKGLQWNAEEKRVEKIRWRAKKGEIYYRMGLGRWIFREIDVRSDSDDRFYDTLNYFRTEKQVAEALKRRKETLRKYHEEIGE